MRNIIQDVVQDVMEHTSRKQKITYIVAAAGFLLLALGILSLMVGRSMARDAAPAETPTPVPETATAAPLTNTVSVAGKDVDPDTDSFDLSGRALSEQDMLEIASLSNLTTLSLTSCEISDLRFIAGLTKLRTLYLPGNKINDLTPLAGLRELKTLYLDRNPLTDFTPLTELPALTMLSIQGVSIANYVLSDLKEAMPGCQIFCDTVVEEVRPISLGGLAFTEDVEVLDLSNRGITDLSKLSYCLQLRELNLEGNPLSSLATLSGLPKLTILHLGSAGLTDEHLEFLQTLRRLTYLDLRNNPALTAEGLEALEEALPECQIYHDTVYFTVTLGNRQLTSDMSDIDLTGLGLANIDGLEKFTMLRRLVVYGNALTDLSPLEEIASLEELVAGYNNLTDLTPLTGHTSLRRLDLQHNVVRDLTPLASCTGLVELDLRDNAVEALEPLYSCTALRHIDLSGNRTLQADQIRRLQEALPACTIITDLDLSMPEPTPIPPGATPIPLIPEYPAGHG